jgi:hypothetical protein
MQLLGFREELGKESASKIIGQLAVASGCHSNVAHTKHLVN